MKQVIAPIFKQNYEGSFDCVSTKPINCDMASIEGMEWFTPVIESGVMKGYKHSRSSTKPTEDSVRTIRVREGGQTFWIAVADNATEAAFADACNLCCDDGTPTMETPTIPTPIIEDCQCKDTDGNTTWLFAFPALVTGQTVTARTTADGVEIGTSTAQSSAANLRTWLNANQSALGTWTVQSDANGTFIKLVSDTVLCASMTIELVENEFCLDTESITFPATITDVEHNGDATELPTPVTVTNLAELIAAIAVYFADGTLTTTLDQVQYTGTGVPTSVTTVTDGDVLFSAGACVALGAGNFTAKKAAPKKAAPKKAAPKKAAPKKGK